MTDVAPVGLGTTATNSGDNPAVLNPVGSASSTSYDVGQGMYTGDAENLDGRSWWRRVQPDGLLDRESHCYR